MPSPFDPEGWTGASDPDGTLTVFTLENASGNPELGLFEQTENTGALGINNNFGNQQSFLAGDEIYAAIMFRLAGTPAGISVAMFDVGGEGLLTFSTFDLTNKTQNGGADDGFKFTDLGGGDYLLEVRKIAHADIPNTYAAFQLYNEAGGGNAPVGTKLYAQAAFFGKADDFPANVMSTL